ncbi:hypothetical protein C8Q78DRAFT_315899 [Trametes maxima]|nr:hypothetical protein C8Q78DRAFT_315899 [Trametes maxima]
MGRGAVMHVNVGSGYRYKGLQGRAVIGKRMGTREGSCPPRGAVCHDSRRVQTWRGHSETRRCGVRGARGYARRGALAQRKRAWRRSQMPLVCIYLVVVDIAREISMSAATGTGTGQTRTYITSAGPASTTSCIRIRICVRGGRIHAYAHAYENVEAHAVRRTSAGRSSDVGRNCSGGRAGYRGGHGHATGEKRVGSRARGRGRDVSQGCDDERDRSAGEKGARVSRGAGEQRQIQRLRQLQSRARRRQAT